MSSWRALNLESDSESDIEVDDTKELQIEDALKLYQTALKYHAEGPGSFDKAAQAYRELFQSEIFRYPESQIELERIETYDPLADDEDFGLLTFDDGALVTGAAVDSSPSTLPQILHLSHKNYAQFRLEYLTARLDNLQVTLQDILTEAATALEHFVQALDKDDSDLDLWRKTAAVGGMLDSKRVARFCLETVITGDEEAGPNSGSLPGLEAGMAAEELGKIIVEVDDTLSILRGPITRRKRKVLSRFLRQRLAVFDEIISRESKMLEYETIPGKGVQQPSRVVLKAPSTWTEIGEAMLMQLMAELHSTTLTAPAPAIAFDLGDVEGTTALTEVKKFHDGTTSFSPEKTLILPKSIPDMFPGLDGGKPTVQPQIASADADIMAIFAENGTDAADTASPAITLTTRKRSADTSGLTEGPEDGRIKSRRIRARDSNAAEAGDGRQALIEANIKWEYEQQLNEFQAADDWMFETVGNLFERIGVVGFEKARDVRQELPSQQSEGSDLRSSQEDRHDPLRLAKLDIHGFLSGFNDQLAYMLLQKGDEFDATSGGSALGVDGLAGNGVASKTLSGAPVLSESGVEGFLELINNGWYSTNDVAYEWLLRLLYPYGGEDGPKNSYIKHSWPTKLKTAVVRTLVNFDRSLLERVETERLGTAARPNIDLRKASLDAEMFQAIFELHLDIYTLIKHPDSGVPAETVAAQANRLRRWSSMAQDVIVARRQLRPDEDHCDQLDLRFLWASAFAIAADPDVSQDHVIECLHEVRRVFEAAGDPVIQLQNNAVMPELSIATVDQEVSRLKTKDFFLKVTSQNANDPLAVIESLEPLLLALDNEPHVAQDLDGIDVKREDLNPAIGLELVNFLRNSTLSVRLLLWKRLRDAYLAIDHRPMVVVCFLRMTRLVMAELQADAVTELPAAERQAAALMTFRMVNNMVGKILGLLQAADNALEYVDDAGLRNAVRTFGDILQLLQVFNVFEDSVRVGYAQPPAGVNGLPLPSFTSVMNMVHELQINIWMILYALLKETINQNGDVYPNSAVDKFDFLRCVHRNLGLRSICGGANRAFVRMLKDEFVHMTHVEGYESEQAQVLYDLYGLNCFLDPSYELIEHHCVHDAFLDRGVAMQAVDLLLVQAAKIPIRDLVKHTLYQTIEKVHGAVPRKRPSEAIIRNREIYRTFMRSPINPIDMYRCLRGEGNELPLSIIPKEDAALASKGWYFLMGHTALTKYRSQKRTQPTPTEDVDISIAFFMQDLEYSMSNWETWFRLAQAYDTKIEESVVWSAEKLNNSMSEIVQQQRAAIHCYTMATSLMHRTADNSIETLEKATELYADFAIRLYSSSREPFSMLPFALDDVDKFLSISTGLGKGKPFAPLRVFTAWKLAKTLLSRAIVGRPHSWTLHYMLGKCLWKMYAAPDHVRLHDSRPMVEQVLAPVIRAIELLPEKKDGREKREPTLEPHYKLVSLVHKLISKGDVSLEDARDAMSHSSYARHVTFPREMDEWQQYVLTVIRNLRAADKSNWHHRMIARAAHIVYSDEGDGNGSSDAIAGPGSILGAMAAKHELTQQMFTKTMVLQVWRPECERAGRHFVYTARYTRFFTKILEQLKDRQSLEALARRVRRRPHDMFEHSAVWQDICNAYLRLLRNYAKLSEGLETSTFSNIAHEDFLARKEPLERWMQAQDPGSSATLDVLREVQELKKINSSLMKPGPIDDLIGDAYAYLFSTVGKQLLEEERKVKLEEEARRPLVVLSPSRNPMSMNHIMNMDGSNESAAAAPSSVSTTSASAPPDAGPQQRKKIGVGRREIRTCAEACVQKVAAAPSNKSAGGTRVQVIIDNSRSAAGDTSVETSAPGSVHDSADDESELSELEEDAEEEVDDEEQEVPRPVFPGLAAPASAEEGDVTREQSTAPDEGLESAKDADVQDTEDAEVKITDINEA